MLMLTGQGKYKMNLEHLVVPENKEILKKWKCVTKDTDTSWKGVPAAKSGKVSKMMIIIYYNPPNEIIHEFMLINKEKGELFTSVFLKI